MPKKMQFKYNIFKNDKIVFSNNKWIDNIEECINDAKQCIESANFDDTIPF